MDIPTVDIATLPNNVQNIFAWLHHSTKTIVEQGDEVTPILFADIGGGQITYTPLTEMMTDGAKKDIVAQLIEDMAHKEGVKFVAFVSEAWALRMNGGEEPDSISDHPNRTEIVMYNVRIGNQQFMASADISRDPNVLGSLQVTALELKGRFAKPVLQ